MSGKRAPRFGPLLRLAQAAFIGAAIASPLTAQDRYPHAAHRGLFPLCAGCHAAADVGADERMYPSASVCANCHDGATARRVRWTPPAVRSSSFRHADHSRRVLDAGSAFDCVDCHRDPDAGGGMTAGALNAGTACAGCHSVHEADSNCGLCHARAPAPAEHPLRAHASCDACHQEVQIDRLPRTRSLCLLCHRELTTHGAARVCVECHVMGGVPGG